MAISTEDLIAATPSHVYADKLPYEVNPKLRDFRYALQLTWKCLGLPAPTPIQYDIALFLQIGGNRRMVQAFRGVGKSWITAAYVAWRLYMNPLINVEVVSASGDFAKDITKFMRQILEGVPAYNGLIPQVGQLDASQMFDVAPVARIASKDPSVCAKGITGQITGTRADILVSDDVETASNAMTATQRSQIQEKTYEYESIVKPDTGEIVFLGTPQTQDSLYNDLANKGYDVRVWPAHFGYDETNYSGTVSPFITEQLAAEPNLASGGFEGFGQPTDTRFDEDDLLKRYLATGKSYYTLQFMLDTRGNLELYPLRLRDLIVTDVDADLAPERMVWTNDKGRRLADDVPNVGLSGDHFHDCLSREAHNELKYAPYGTSVLIVDPSGRGGDETSYAVVKERNGFLYLTAWGGFTDGYDESRVLVPLVQIAKNHAVDMIVSESNMGDGMFNKLLEPVLRRGYPGCGLDEVRSNAQKERRICDTLEPVMNNHRLVIDKQVIRDDLRLAQMNYSGDTAVQRTGIYQMSRMTRTKDCLWKDDRIDALAMAVAWHTSRMNTDAENEASARADREFDEEIAEFMGEAAGGWGSKSGVQISMLNRSRGL